MRRFLSSGLFAVLLLVTFGGSTAQAQEGKEKGKAADTCHVTYYCSGRDGSEQGPYQTTAGVEQSKCATNSSRVIDSISCAVRGTGRVTAAIWGPVPQPIAERCNVGFRCPGNSQTLRLSFATSQFGCKAGYVGAFKDFRQNVPYHKYHNEFTSQIAFICPSASGKRNSSGIGRAPTSVESVQWALPPATPVVNPSINCSCTTRCLGKNGYAAPEEVEFSFQTPFNENLCSSGYYEADRPQAACTARGLGRPQPTLNYRPCLETFATGDTTGKAMSQADWGGDGTQTVSSEQSESHDWDVTQ